MVLKSTNKSKFAKKYITKNDCLKTLVTTLTTYLPIKINGSLTPKQLYTQLASLFTYNYSVHSSSKLFQNFLSETAFRYQLGKFDMETLMESNYDLLYACAHPHIVPGRQYACAIDITDDPYYGKIDKINKEFVRIGQKKKSTRKSYSYATLSIIEKNEKFILAVVPVDSDYQFPKAVKNLIKIFDKQKITPKVICLDTGFYIVDVMKVLVGRNIPFIIPTPDRRGKLRNIVQNTKKSTKYKYTAGEPERNHSVDFILAVRVIREKEDGKWVTKKLPYATYGVDEWSFKKISRIYSHRFSIEASYRIRNEVKPRTSTKSPVIRYLFAIISFLIENIWLSFQLRFFTKQQRGPKVIVEDLFRLSDFLMLVNEKLRKELRVITEVKTLRGGGSER